MPKDATTFAQMGMAALLPGMTHMLELMQGELDRMRAMIERVQSASQDLKRGPGRPPSIARKTPSKSGWDKFTTPEARSREMLRRRAVRAAKEAKNGGQVVKNSKASYERLSVAGLERGSEEYRKIDAENKRRQTAALHKKMLPQ